MNHKILVLIMCVILISFTSNVNADYLEKATQEYNELRELGIESDFIMDLIYEINSTENGPRQEELYNEAKNYKKEVIKAIDEINSVNLLIEEMEKMSYDVQKAKELYDYAQIELKLGNIKQARTLAKEASNLLTENLGSYKENIINQLNYLEWNLNEKNIRTSRVVEFKKDINHKLLSVIAKEFLALNSSSQALIIANDELYSLKNDELPYELIEDMLNNAKISYGLGDYGSTIIQLEKTLNEINRIRAINKQITEYQQFIIESELDVSEMITIMEKLKLSYLQSRFDESEEILREIEQVKQEIVADSLIMGIEKGKVKGQLNYWLIQNWWITLLVICAFVFLFIIIYPVTKQKYCRFKIEKLKKEDKVIILLIKKAQTNYYKDKIISKSNYDKLIESYQTRRVDIEDKNNRLKQMCKEKTFK